MGDIHAVQAAVGSHHIPCNPGRILALAGQGATLYNLIESTIRAQLVFLLSQQPLQPP